MKTHNHNLFSFFVSVLAVALLSSPVRADDKKDDDKNNKKGKKSHKEESKHVDSRTSHSSGSKERDYHDVPVRPDVHSRSNTESRSVVHGDQQTSVNRDSHSAKKPAEHNSRTGVHYVERHEHHSAEWYSSRGWREDSDYWRSYHRHRYYNDSEAIVIIEPLIIESGNRSGFYTGIAVQRALADIGYYNGDIDGEIGPGSQNAIANYQRDSGMRPTGLINDRLLESLGIR